MTHSSPDSETRSMDGQAPAVAQQAAVPATQDHPAAASLPPSRLDRLRQQARTYRASLLLLWLPTLLAALYYFLIAADLYSSEAKFVVRSPSRVQVSPLSNLLQSTGITRAQDDVYSVNDFVVSRDAVAALEKRLPLRAMFKRPEADYLSAYPNLFYDESAEDFYRYYLSRVTVSYDTTSGISTITVKAFRADDARKIAETLIEESEALVNRLNDRARRNAIADAQADVTLAESRVIAAQKQVLGYRTREELLDPAKASGALFDAVAKLKAELIASQIRLADLERSSPDSPLKAGLQSRIAALQTQVQTEQAKLAGRSGSLAPKIPEYEQLMLQQELAAKGLASTMASLESARADARRQQIYLDRVVAPNLPDKALYPKRLVTVLVVFISCFMAFAVGKLLIAGVREHAQD